MNVPSFRSLSGTIPKIDKLNEISTTTFVVSPNDGLAIILSDDNQLKYSFTKSNSALSKDDLLSPSLLLLTSESKDLFQKSQFSDILLNQDSTKLLLWSRETSIVAYIELNIIMHQNEKKLRESKLIQVSLKSSLSSNSIVKVSFHPLSSHHIVILYQRGSLVLTNLNTMTSQFMSLCRELSFISFSFGPRVDWMIATIFLVEKGGDVYALCPILPSNCKLPERNIEEMYIWLEEQREAFDSSYTGTSGVVRGVNSTNLVSQYVSTAKAYLLSTLSTPNEDNDDYDDDDAILGLNTTNTGYATDSVLSTLGSIGTTTAIADTQSANYKIPSLQGPIKPRRCDISRVATDICVPVSSQGQSVPVLLISYSNGDVDTYLTGCPSNPNPNPNLNISPNPGNDMYSNSDVYTDAYRGEEACGVGPSWIPDEEDPGTLFSYPLPSIQFVECISVGGALPVTKSAVVEGGPGNTTDLSPSLSWQLIPDPGTLSILLNINIDTITY